MLRAGFSGFIVDGALSSVMSSMPITVRIARLSDGERRDPVVRGGQLRAAVGQRRLAGLTTCHRHRVLTAAFRSGRR